jgi:hypothetical protein
MKNSGVCCRECDAEFVGFYCGYCHKFVDVALVSRNDENNLIHMVEEVQHEFDEQCYTKKY